MSKGKNWKILTKHEDKFKDLISKVIFIASENEKTGVDGIKDALFYIFAGKNELENSIICKAIDIIVDGRNTEVSVNTFYDVVIKDRDKEYKRLSAHIYGEIVDLLVNSGDNSSCREYFCGLFNPEHAHTVGDLYDMLTEHPTFEKV